MTKNILILLILILGTLLLFPVSCTNNNEFDLYGEVECDTTNLTWESDIAEILNNNCVVCHGPNRAYNGVRHDSYGEELKVIDDGRLRGVVNHLDGYSRMPKDLPKLPECELLKINKWLDNGAPEK